MSDIHITLTQNEAQATVQLIEIAIRAGGSQNGRVGIPIQDKILAAAAAAESKPAAIKPALTNAGGDPTQP